MSVTKISDDKNLNLLQQVEMQLRHVYFHHTLPYHVGYCACVLHHFMKLLMISLGLHTWRSLHTLLELLLNIKEPRVLNYIESWSYSYALWCGIWVSTRFLHVWGYGAGCCNVIKNAAKNAFLLQIFKIWTWLLWQPTDEDATCMSSCLI